MDTKKIIKTMNEITKKCLDKLDKIKIEIKFKEKQK